MLKVKLEAELKKIKAEAKYFIRKCKNRPEVNMFSEMESGGNYSLNEVYERMLAGDQLGYETLIVQLGEYKELKFKIIYRKKMPQTPYEFT